VTGALAAFALAQPPAQPGRFTKPPVNCLTLQVDGKEYLRGMVYLDAHKDTALLKPFGFEHLDFDGWAAARVRYHAIWPRSVVLDSLPLQVSGIEYDQTALKDSTPAIEDEDLTNPDSLEPPPAEPQQ
jgi:hypothetical protein